MKLSGEQFEAISLALLDAFNPGSLEAMVRFQLGQKLNQIAKLGPLTEVVHDLIEWAEAQDQVQQLIESACVANPGNGRLQALRVHAQAENWFGTKLMADDASPGAVYSRIGEIKRKALEERLAILTQQYEAVSNQLNVTLNAADQVKLQRQLEDLGQQMQAVATELSRLR